MAATDEGVGYELGYAFEPGKPARRNLQLVWILHEYVTALGMEGYLKTLTTLVAVGDWSTYDDIVTARWTRKNRVGLVRVWRRSNEQRSENFSSRYSRDESKPDRYNEFIRHIEDYDLSLEVTPHGRKPCVLSFFIDMELENNVYSYCIRMDLQYAANLLDPQSLSQVVVFRFPPGFNKDALSASPPVPTLQQIALVHAQLRRGLLHSLLAPHHVRYDSGVYSVNVEHTTSGALWGAVTRRGAAALGVASEHLFCTIDYKEEGGAPNGETIRCARYSDLTEWIASHPLTKASASLAAVLERAVGRLLAVLAIE
jgi:hypothetical protein